MNSAKERAKSLGIEIASRFPSSCDSPESARKGAEALASELAAGVLRPELAGCASAAIESFCSELASNPEMLRQGLSAGEPPALSGFLRRSLLARMAEHPEFEMHPDAGKELLRALSRPKSGSDSKTIENAIRKILDAHASSPAGEDPEMTLGQAMRACAQASVEKFKKQRLAKAEPANKGLVESAMPPQSGELAMSAKRRAPESHPECAIADKLETQAQNLNREQAKSMGAFSELCKTMAENCELAGKASASFLAGGLLWLAASLAPRVIGAFYKRDVARKERPFPADEALRLEYSAVCAADCYRDPIPGATTLIQTQGANLRRLGSYGVRGSSFGAAFYSGDGIAVLAFRGTEMTDRKDWISNLRQHFLGAQASAQYRQAKALCSDFLDNVLELALAGHAPKEIVIAGHSLGGGLAQYAALSCPGQIAKLRALGIHVHCAVFNSAALGPETCAELDAKGAGPLAEEIVTSYRASADPLNNRILGRGKIYGFEEEFESPEAPNATFSVASHAMNSVLEWARKKAREAVALAGGSLPSPDSGLAEMASPKASLKLRVA